MRNFQRFAFLFLPLLAMCVCSYRITPSILAQQTPSTYPRKIPTGSLHNCIQVTESIFSGAVPEGESSFRELQKLGVKTIVSVDGMRPQIDLARQYEIAYVHLPHGYDGIPEERKKELMKALWDSPKPIYVHCHHGKHRSPAAVASTCISLGWISSEQGKKVLEIAGTNPNFRGLIQSVENSIPIDIRSLESYHPNLVESAELPPLVETMVAMDDLLDRLTKQPKGSNPTESSIADSALLLSEHYTELFRISKNNNSPPEYVRFLEAGERHSRHLESLLRRQSLDSAGESLNRVKENCSQCHQKFRDNRSSR